MSKSLDELRTLIDDSDEKLLQLLNQRAGYANEVGKIKHAEGSTVFRPEREAQVIQGLQSRNQGPLKDDNLAFIWREIMSACRALEAPQRVAYLGPEGTFSEQAAVQFFGSSMKHIACASIDQVFAASVSGQAEYGVIPVENSTEGVIGRSLDLLQQSPLHIVGESSLLVRHHLLRNMESLEGIAAVYAHPQALAQCQVWLNAHLPNVQHHACSSNAEGARLASQNPNIVAIASSRAASRYGLFMVEQAIQDEAYNRTRFAVVCLPQVSDVPQPSGRDCISLVISVPNRPGAVYDILNPLKQHGVSMTRFESRPAKSGAWEYFFFIDLVGHPEQEHVGAALAALKQLCAYYKVLGTYPRAD